MHRIITFLIILIVSGTGLLHAGSSAEIRLDQSAAGDWQITETRAYSDKELYGYMDGGAEIYREFGFKRLTVQNLKKGQREMQVEIYEMDDPRSAFGIFSVSRRNCPSVDSLTRYSCSTPYQLLLARNVYYITITNYEGSPELQNVAFKFARKLLTKISGPDMKIPALFQKPPFESDLFRLRFISGELGLQNGIPGWLPLFEGLSDWSLFILPIENNDGEIDIAQIVFQTPADAQKFCRQAEFEFPAKRKSEWQKAPDSKQQKALYPVSDRELYFVEAPAGSENFDQVLEQVTPDLN